MGRRTFELVLRRRYTGARVMHAARRRKADACRRNYRRRQTPPRRWRLPFLRDWAWLRTRQRLRLGLRRGAPPPLQGGVFHAEPMIFQRVTGKLLQARREYEPRQAIARPAAAALRDFAACATPGRLHGGHDDASMQKKMLGSLPTSVGLTHLSWPRACIRASAAASWRRHAQSRRFGRPARRPPISAMEETAIRHRRRCHRIENRATLLELLYYARKMPLSMP